MIAFAPMPVAVLLLTAVLAGGDLPRMDQVAWLRGCWETQTREGTIEAQWLPPRASSMLGVSRTIHGTRLVDYEMDLIRERGDGLTVVAARGGGHERNGVGSICGGGNGEPEAQLPARARDGGGQ